ncbi:MAG: hypothetical protein K2X87_30980, partial [Gemmataceae bacterium]|nr:hypothetical protein [Gemmataceae bacterium]
MTPARLAVVVLVLVGGRVSAQPDNPKKEYKDEDDRPVVDDPSPSASYRLRVKVERVDGGVVVTGVEPDGPATQMNKFGWRPAAGGWLELVLTEFATIQEGDVIEAVDGETVRSTADLARAVNRAGQRCGAAVVRVRDRNTGAAASWVVHPAPDRIEPGVKGIPGLAPPADPKAPPERAPLDPGRQPAYRLLADFAGVFGRVVVTRVDPDGPAAKVKRYGWQEIRKGELTLVQTTAGRLEPGDVIVGVDGAPVSTAAECRAAVDRAGRTAGAAVLRVRDKNTGRVGSGVAYPAPVRVDPAAARPPRRNDKVKLLVLADDDDQVLGKGFRRSAALLVGMAATAPGLQPADAAVLTTSGDAVLPRRPGGRPEPGATALRTAFDRDDVEAAVRDLRVGKDDALVCFVLAHGAHAADGWPADDASQGHRFEQGNARLTRYDLLAALRAPNPALVVLMSDSCGQQLPPAQPPPKKDGPPAAAALAGSPLMDHLLRDYRGVVDVNACTKPELAWYWDPAGGDRIGHFTAALIRANRSDTPLSWDGYLDRVGKLTDERYQDMRRAWPNQAQPKQTPKVFATTKTTLAGDRPVE